MSGFGSGRWGWGSTKTKVEDCYKWRITGLKDCLTPGFLGATRWMVGERESGSISFRVLGGEHPEALKVSYTIGARSGNPQDFEYRINLTTTPLPWGGVRYWFVCPLQGCYRRVGCLYLPPGGKYFGCRHCYDLSYRSQTDYHTDKRMFAWLAASIQDEYPGVTGKELQNLFNRRDSRDSDRYYSEEYWRALARYEKRESYLSADELCQQCGLTLEILKKLEDARLLVPDTKDRRYRPKLVGWGGKLAYLLDQGWELEEIKRWAGGRFKTGNPKQWPPERINWQ